MLYNYIHMATLGVKGLTWHFTQWPWQTTHLSMLCVDRSQCCWLWLVSGILTSSVLRRTHCCHTTRLTHCVHSVYSTHWNHSRLITSHTQFSALIHRSTALCTHREIDRCVTYNVISMIYLYQPYYIACCGADIPQQQGWYCVMTGW